MAGAPGPVTSQENLIERFFDEATEKKWVVWFELLALTNFADWSEGFTAFIAEKTLILEKEYKNVADKLTIHARIKFIQNVQQHKHNFTLKTQILNLAFQSLK